MTPNPTLRTSKQRLALIEKGEWYQIYSENDPKRPLFEGKKQECLDHAKQFNLILGGSRSKHVLAQFKKWEVVVK